MTPAIKAELQALLGKQYTPKVEALAGQVDKLPALQWEALSEEAKVWANQVIVGINAKLRAKRGKGFPKTSPFDGYHMQEQVQP